jgi:PAS domain S-box-containing protein
VAERRELGKLFWAAFTQSRNAMVLLDDDRRIVDANGPYLNLLGYAREQLVNRHIYTFNVGGVQLSPAAWQAAMATGEFSGERELLAADGSKVGMQLAATTEIVTGRRLVLLVALSTSRWGRHYRRTATLDTKRRALSPREREIVRLVALGYTGPEIADELRIAHDTVRTHTRNAMTKVGARSRAQLVAKALGEGLILD